MDCAGRILSSAAILAKQGIEWLRTGRTQGRESARVSSRANHHQHQTGSRMPIIASHRMPTSTLTNGFPKLHYLLPLAL